MVFFFFFLFFVCFVFYIISLHLLIFLYKNVSPLGKIIGVCNIFNITSNVLSLYCRNSSMTKGSIVRSFLECKVGMPSPEQAMT